MDSNEREDIYEAERLDDFVDLSVLSFNDTRNLFLGFCNEVLLSREIIERMGIKKEYLIVCKYIANSSIDFYKKEISDNEASRRSIFAVTLHRNMKEKSIEKNLLMVLRLMCDEESSMFNVSGYGADALFENFFGCLFDLGSGYCRLFTDYVIENFQKRSGILANLSKIAPLVMWYQLGMAGYGRKISRGFPEELYCDIYMSVPEENYRPQAKLSFSRTEGGVGVFVFADALIRSSTLNVTAKIASSDDNVHLDIDGPSVQIPLPERDAHIEEKLNIWLSEFKDFLAANESAVIAALLQMPSPRQ
jgi:hypothetical protein